MWTADVDERYLPWEEVESYLWLQFEKNTFKAWRMLFPVPFDDYIAAKAGVILPPNFTEYAIL